MRMASAREKQGEGDSWVWHEKAYLAICAWDLFLENPDLRRDTHTHTQPQMEELKRACHCPGWIWGGRICPICKNQIDKSLKKQKVSKARSYFCWELSSSPIPPMVIPVQHITNDPWGHHSLTHWHLQSANHSKANGKCLMTTLFSAAGLIR